MYTNTKYQTKRSYIFKGPTFKNENKVNPQRWDYLESHKWDLLGKVRSKLTWMA